MYVYRLLLRFLHGPTHCLRGRLEKGLFKYYKHLHNVHHKYMHTYIHTYMTISKGGSKGIRGVQEEVSLPATCSVQGTGTCIHTYIQYIHTYLHTYTYTCIYTQSSWSTYLSIQIRIQNTNVHSSIHICIHAYIHASTIFLHYKALEMFSKNPFKVSLISNKIPDGAKTTVYRSVPLPLPMPYLWFFLILVCALAFSVYNH